MVSSYKQMIFWAVPNHSNVSTSYSTILVVGEVETMATYIFLTQNVLFWERDSVNNLWYISITLSWIFQKA